MASRRSANARVEAGDRATADDLAGCINREFIEHGAEAGTLLAAALIANAMHRARQSERRRNRRTK